MGVHEDALSFAKANSRELIEQCCNTKVYTPSSEPFTLFMAGSPGAGKTEYSRNFLKELEATDPTQKIIRLDTDELRELLPQYNGENSDEVQAAATLLFDRAFDFIQKKQLNTIIDSTFASPRSLDNVKRALGRRRKVGIFYLYQDPLIAWDYTQKREKLEGRKVPKHVFIDAYFTAKKNVNLAKTIYTDQIELNLFEKDDDNNFVRKAKFNIKSLDEVLKERYTREELVKKLADEL